MTNRLYANATLNAINKHCPYNITTGNPQEPTTKTTHHEAAHIWNKIPNPLIKTDGMAKDEQHIYMGAK